MRKIEYYIPESREELESLVGKLVIVCPSQYVVPQHGDSYTYFGVKNSKHELIKQQFEYSDKSQSFYPRDRISAWLIDDKSLAFQIDGIFATIRQVVLYKPHEVDYQERLKILKENGSWEEP